jgi:hypothetical protein
MTSDLKKANGRRVIFCLLFYVYIGAVFFQPPAWADLRMPQARIAGKNVVKLEVATSESEIERGLMYRTYLPEDCGMVFLFNPPRPIQFWMYHTLIPLDMCFINNGKIVKIFHEVPPCRSENPGDCPTYPQGSGLLASEVIEVNGGYAKRHGIKEGDKVTFEIANQVNSQ